MKTLKFALLFVVIITINGCSSQFYQIAQSAYQDVVDSDNNRYGTGSMSDANNYPDLAPWLSQINKMCDSGIISVEERDKRKTYLIQSYNEYKGGKISPVEFEKIKKSLTS